MWPVQELFKIKALSSAQAFVNVRSANLQELS